MLKWQNTVTSSILAVPNVIAHPSTDINETYCTTVYRQTRNIAQPSATAELLVVL